MEVNVILAKPVLSHPAMRLSRILLLLNVCLGAAGPASADTESRFQVRIDPALIVWAADEDGGSPVVTDFIVGRGLAPERDLIADDGFAVLTGALTPTQGMSGDFGTAGRMFAVGSSPDGNFTVDGNGNGATDPGDTLAPFRLSDQTDIGVANAPVRTSFFVASNAPFNIDAQATRTRGLTDLWMLFINWDMTVTRTGNASGMSFGTQAQLPHSAGPDGGIFQTFTLLSLINRRTVFTGNRATAASPGSIMDQSVRFDVTYELGQPTGYDLSDGAVQLEIGTFDLEVEVVYTMWIP